MIFFSAAIPAAILEALQAQSVATGSSAGGASSINPSVSSAGGGGIPSQHPLSQWFKPTNAGSGGDSKKVPAQQ